MPAWGAARCTDIDWLAGAGAEVGWPVQSLLLLLTDRTEAAPSQLSGPGAERLAATGTSPQPVELRRSSQPKPLQTIRADMNDPPWPTLGGGTTTTSRMT
jgi:hypothetical protein